MLEIAGAIRYLHSRHMIHRDIKTDNILLRDKTPLLSDFGLSRELKNADEMKVTQVGTPSTTAPELIAGERVTSLVDVYSFGCILNEMFGEKPSWFDYHYTTIQEFDKWVIGGHRPTILPTVPHDVAELVKMCFRTKETRPTMTEVIAIMKEWKPETW